MDSSSPPAARKQMHLKFRTRLEPSALLGAGCELLGSVTVKDTYLLGSSVLRIREESGKHYLTVKDETGAGTFARVRSVVRDECVSTREAERLIRERGVRAVIFQRRTFWRLRDSTVSVDEVEQLGTFAEVRAESEESLGHTIASLGLRKEDGIRESYLELVLKEPLPFWRQAVMRFHERVGELAFGITSGILTTLGILVGVDSATSAKLPVVAALVMVAIADSFSDAFGMFMSKSSERGASRLDAWRYGVSTFIGKLAVPSLLAIPILLSNLQTAVAVDVAMALVLLALMSAENALATNAPILKIVCRNVALALCIVFFSWLAGYIVAMLLPPG